MAANAEPIVLITGAGGNIGSRLSKALAKDYQVLGLDKTAEEKKAVFECDLTDDDSVHQALERMRKEYGSEIAGVIHLAAYFDFSGEHSPLYETVNVEGTCRLLEALQTFKVDRFIYSSTMLVQAPGVPGQKINEQGNVKPGWAYPQSKADAEQTIQQHHGHIPYTLLRLAGLYDDVTAVPTLSHQIARVYEKDFKSHVYSGDLMAGQAFIHIDDMIEVFCRTLAQRKALPEDAIILAGEDQVMGYQALQNRIGQLLYGEQKWETLNLPEPLAKAGAWLEEKAEPLVPDAIDHGEKPFIRAFMIDLSSNHYDLDIRRVREWLDWQPKHNIWYGLETLIDNLKKNPADWYRKNGLTLPYLFSGAEQHGKNAHRLRCDHQQHYRDQHQDNLWAHFINAALACWLLTAPYTLAYESQAMIYSDLGSGIILLVFSLLSLSWRLSFARWVCGLVGLWLLGAPLLFWAPTAAAYMNGTLVGMLVIGFSLLIRPTPGVSALASETGPVIPLGWDYAPSAWNQRLPIIILAVLGFLISRYLCAYQLGHIDSVWEPFFSGSAMDSKNGTEEIITSSVSEAWPVPDAGLGAMTYALEILTGILGSRARWRTMPWLVVAFGIMIVPLGAISIFFIIIQPIVIGTWCTLCLIAAAAMLIQIPYSLDELVATGQFLLRRKREGRPLLRIFFLGDTDEPVDKEADDSFERGPVTLIKDMLGGGITFPKGLLVCAAIGIWLMFTRLTLEQEGGMANADHLVGALVITVAITALAEAGRAVRLLIIPLGLVLLFTPFIYSVSLWAMVNSWLCGLILIGFCIPKGPVIHGYGSWNPFIR